MNACFFVGSRLVLADGGRVLPSQEDVLGWGLGEVPHFPVERNGSRALAGVAAEGWEPPRGVTSVSLRTALAVLPESHVSLALVAAHLVRWRRTSRFCGVCGHPTRLSELHQAMECRSCSHLTFPKVSPAVIVQVTRGSEILLGRSRRHPPGSYSVLAGFVDPGESLEDAVRREIHEESGITVKNIGYFGSQPWPFPDSLMVGFRAEYEGGSLVCHDDELEEVGWFEATSLPPVPPPYSIARTLIEDFALRHGIEPSSIPTWQGRR